MNNTIIIFTDDATVANANLVTQAASASAPITGLAMYTNKVVVRTETAGPMTNALLITARGCNDPKILYTASGSNITFATGYELWIDAGKTYTPTTGTVTADDIEIKGSSATFNPGANSVTIHSSLNVNSGGVLTTSGTVTFDGTASGNTINPGSSHFYNLTFNSSNGNGVWSPLTNTVYVDNDLTMTAGTFDTSSGTADVEVRGNVQGTAGIINFTTTNTFTQNVSTTGKTFGTTSGSAAWTFNNLTFTSSSGTPTINVNAGTGDITVGGVLTIAGSTTLNAGARTYYLTGSGTPFVINGTFTASTSTIIYSATADTTVTAANYYNLIILNPSSIISTPYVWVANFGGTTVSRIDTSTGAVTTYDGFSIPYGTALTRPAMSGWQITAPIMSSNSTALPALLSTLILSEPVPPVLRLTRPAMSG